MHKTVEEFLGRCRFLIGCRKVDPFTNNGDTKSTLNLLGYTLKAMYQEIIELEKADCRGGPYPDRSSKHGGHVWIFVKPIQGYSIYIKLKIRVIDDDEELFIMSFHPER